MIASILGYIASILLAISLMVNNDLKFRWLNTLGCMAFIIYGLFINALPVILTNSLLLLINGYYLVKIYRATEHFDLLEFEPKVSLAKKFLSFYAADIRKYFPAFNGIREIDNLRFVVLRDIVIANMFAAHLDEEGTAKVNLNYTVAKYRDYKVGKFIFEEEKKFLLSKGVKRILYEQPVSPQHEKFLTVMGFQRSSDNGATRFIKEIN